MTTLRLIPTNLKGQVIIPSSKSMGHRELICAALAEGKSIVNNISMSEDIKATCRAMEALGAHIDCNQDNSGRMNFTVKGGVLGAHEQTIDCGESGSTLRFIIPVAVLGQEKISFNGHGKLVTRPLQPYYDIFDRQGLMYTTTKEGYLPLTVQGPLHAGEYILPGNVSSQFISGLLFALPLLTGNSVLLITGVLESQSYVLMTLSVLAKYGIQIKHINYKRYEIRGGQKYLPRTTSVEGDFSQVAFWLVAGILGGNISCLGMEKDSLQGDKVIIDILLAMGGAINYEGNSLSVKPVRTRGIVIDAANCPDLIPILAVLGALSKGRTEIINAGRLRIKECDRLAAITRELNKIGAKIIELPAGLIIEGIDNFTGGVVDCWNDHRIAMSLAVASIRCTKPLTLTGTECVAKSYPKFWEDFASLGGNYEQCIWR
ncbi:MAG: 3-phosphoshikimate 1-carboxyvinyltransferase [Acidaminococcaceae bacterium]|nr:3-phosphoshikimate 1-carboxyvinyltransferase [Acidaminococcaceae bacterium]